MDKNTLNQSLDNIMNVIEKLHPQEQNILLAQAVDTLMNSRMETIKMHKEQADVLTRANEKLMKMLNQEDPE